MSEEKDIYVAANEIALKSIVKGMKSSKDQVRTDSIWQFIEYLRVAVDALPALEPRT